MKLVHFAISIALLLIVVSMSFGEDISISASVDTKNVSVGDSIIYVIHVQGIQAIPAPKLPEIDGFQSRYIGPKTQLSMVNGQTRVYGDHQYELRTTKEGNFTIPSIPIRYSDRLYRTSPIQIQVSASARTTQRRAMTQEELQKYIRLDIATKKDTAYISEGIPLLIRLYIRSGIKVENYSRRPRFSSAGFSVIPLGNPVQGQIIISGIRFITIDFSTTMYPVRTGQLVLGPAEMDCRASVSPNTRRRGARYEMTVKSEPHAITVKPLPTAGRPEDFSGLVGHYNLHVEAKPLSLKVREPITLTMTVRGDGNIDAVSTPRITDLTWFKVYDPQINMNRKGNTGIKTFEQVLIPTSADVRVIPEIRFSYFDPDEEQYKTEIKGPIRIQVEPSDDEGVMQILDMANGRAIKREVLGKDIFQIKNEMGSVVSGDGRLYKNKGFLLLQLLPLLGFVGVLVYQRRRERFATDRTYARQYHAPRKAKKGLARAEELIASGEPQESCSAIFKTMQEYLGDRFNLSSAGITIEIVDSLRTQGFPEEVLGRLTAFFQTCDRTRFSQSEMSKSDMTEILDLAKEIIKFLETSKSVA